MKPVPNPNANTKGTGKGITFI